jgi:hypothetical protein
MQLVPLPFTFNSIPTPSWAQSPNESHPWHPRVGAGEKRRHFSRYRPGATAPVGHPSAGTR